MSRPQQYHYALCDDAMPPGLPVEEEAMAEQELQVWITDKGYIGHLAFANGNSLCGIPAAQLFRYATLDEHFGQHWYDCQRCAKSARARGLLAATAPM